MDAVEVVFEEQTRTRSRVYLHEDRQKLLQERFGDGPYSSEQMTEFLEEEQIIYFDPDEAEILGFEVLERDITSTKQVDA